MHFFASLSIIRVIDNNEKDKGSAKMYVVQVLHGYISQSNGWTRAASNARRFDTYEQAAFLARRCGGVALLFEDVKDTIFDS